MAEPATWIQVLNGAGGVLGAVSAAVVGGYALTVQRRTHSEERDRQAALADQEMARLQQAWEGSQERARERARLWEQRTSAYAQVLEALQSGAGLDDRHRALAMRAAAWPLRPRVHLFGSPGVATAFDRFLNASSRVGEGTLDDRARGAWSAADYELRREIRLSLGGDMAVELDLRPQDPVGIDAFAVVAEPSPAPPPSASTPAGAPAGNGQRPVEPAPPGPRGPANETEPAHGRHRKVS
jgi:hypothetical protein